MYLVYVGRLSADTTADNVRRHLANENVNNIADVFDLKGKLRAKQASFCVSFDNETAMKNVFTAGISCGLSQCSLIKHTSYLSQRSSI